MRHCALPACAAANTAEHRLFKCGGCSIVFYCSKDCQKRHWRVHKPVCSPSLSSSSASSSSSSSSSASPPAAFKFARAVGPFKGPGEYRPRDVPPLLSHAPAWLADPELFARLHAPLQDGVSAQLIRMLTDNMTTQRAADAQYRRLVRLRPRCDNATCHADMRASAYECICGERFCSKKCQVQAWASHAKICRVVRNNNEFEFKLTEIELSLPD